MHSGLISTVAPWEGGADYSGLAKIANLKYDEVASGGAHTMPTRNVNLTDELDRFVLAKVASGQYENASEVVRTALRGLDREERMNDAKLAALRNAIDEGDASGLARGDVFKRVRRKLLEKGRG